MGRRKKKYTDGFLKYHAWIVGIIDSYGAVHSRIYDFEEAEMHGDIWPHQTHHRWRWDDDKGLRAGLNDSGSFDREEWDHVRCHVTKMYGIKFMENGYHEAIHAKDTEW